MMSQAFKLEDKVSNDDAIEDVKQEWLHRIQTNHQLYMSFWKCAPKIVLCMPTSGIYTDFSPIPPDPNFIKTPPT